MNKPKAPVLDPARVYLKNPGPLPVLFLAGLLVMMYQIYPKAFSGQDMGATLLLLGGFILSALCIVWTVRGLQRGQTLLRAVQQGQAVTAHIDQIYETRIRKSGKHSYLWTMTWQDESGEKGHAVPAPKNRFEAFSPGEALTLWRDPVTGKKFWEGDL